MLRRIGLQNFKCWRELDIELAPITLFFGVNSSGKTAISGIAVDVEADGAEF